MFTFVNLYCASHLVLSVRALIRHRLIERIDLIFLFLLFWQDEDATGLKSHGPIYQPHCSRSCLRELQVSIFTWAYKNQKINLSICQQEISGYAKFSSPLRARVEFSIQLHHISRALHPTQFPNLFTWSRFLKSSIKNSIPRVSLILSWHRSWSWQ